jgi:hypothetical protein
MNDGSCLLAVVSAAFSSRVFKMGHQPVTAQVQNFYNAIHPKTLPHPQWQFRVQFAVLSPAEK